MNVDEPRLCGEKPVSRKPYNSPVLSEYGDIANLTKANHISVISDHGSNGMSPMLP